MKKLTYSLTLLIMIASVAACTGGPSRLSSKGYCSNSLDNKGNVINYQPIPLETKDVNYKLAKLEGIGGSETEAEKAQKLDTGEYEYVISEVFYEELLVDSDLNNPYRRVHFKHKYDEDGADLFATSCVSNMPYNGKLNSMGGEAFINFSVSGSKTQVGEIAYLSARFEENFLFRSISLEKADDPDFSPKDYMTSLKADYKLYKVENGQDFDHEMRIKHTVDENTTVHMMVRYKKK